MRTSIIQIVTITLMLIPCLPFIQAEPENYFRLTLHYNNGTISMKTLVVLPLALPTAKGSGDFTANLVSFENNTLNSTTFGFPRQVFYDSWNEETGEISGGGVFLLDEADEMVSICN
ncbi:hypothetical protein HYT55_00015 [Candidatus Woesearchaeota archaeon]|nr:hypothetical protein [Candidatus Woesearchaeota archaeon]